MAPFKRFVVRVLFLCLAAFFTYLGITSAFADSALGVASVSSLPGLNEEQIRVVNLAISLQSSYETPVWAALSVCMQESSLRDINSPNVNENGKVLSTDIGVCQINNVAKPELAIKAAKGLKQGLRSGYKVLDICTARYFCSEKNPCGNWGKDFENSGIPGVSRRAISCYHRPGAVDDSRSVQYASLVLEEYKRYFQELVK
ncbi:hypothetical protein ACFL0C_01920 [Patescibacteria group bacterium]